MLRSVAMASCSGDIALWNDTVVLVILLPRQSLFTLDAGYVCAEYSDRMCIDCAGYVGAENSAHMGTECSGYVCAECPGYGEILDAHFLDVYGPTLSACVCSNRAQCHRHPEGESDQAQLTASIVS